MKAFAFCRITLLAFLIALACLLAGCGADDDDDDDNEVNGWERSACAWVREEMDSEEGEFEPVEDIEDCIPLLPDESYREDLEAMLRLYLGLYEDQESVEKEVSCRPEGLWVLPIPSPPGVPCVPTWAIPVWVRLSGLEEQVEGGVCQDYSPDPDWPLSEIALDLHPPAVRADLDQGGVIHAAHRREEPRYIHFGPSVLHYYAGCARMAILMQGDTAEEGEIKQTTVKLKFWE